MQAVCACAVRVRENVCARVCVRVCVHVRVRVRVCVHVRGDRPSSRGQRERSLAPFVLGGDGYAHRQQQLRASNGSGVRGNG